MRNDVVKSKGAWNLKVALITMTGCFSPLSAANADPIYSEGDWLVGVNAVKVFTSETLDSVSMGGARIPQAGIDVTDDATLSIDASYFLNSSFALNFFGFCGCAISQNPDAS